MQSHAIQGDDLQMVTIVLNWMHPDISFEAKTGDGSERDKGFFGKNLRCR